MAVTRDARTPLEVWAPVVLVLAVLVFVNLFNNELGRPAVVATALAGTAALLLIAKADGESRDDLGLARPSRAAWLAAGAMVAAVGVVYTVGALIPATRDAFVNDKTESLGAAEALVQAMVVVPLGTVILEEVAFRGVLLGMLKSRFGWAWGIAGSSIVFGLWHVLPSLGLSESNEAIETAGPGGGLGQFLGVLLAVIFTTVAGVLFCLLRKRFDSLLVPIALHWATNGLGYLFGVLVITS